MSQALTSALRRIEHDLSLHAVRVRLRIAVDQDEHDRLVARRSDLEAQRDAERREGMAALERHAKSEAPVVQDSPTLAPMLIDETMSECERRIYFGDPPRTLSEWL